MTQTNRVHAAAMPGAAGTFVLLSGVWRTICERVAMPRGRAGAEERVRRTRNRIRRYLQR